MIVRTAGDHLLLVTQPDHARLAERIIDGWQRDGFPASPRREAVLLATLAHDDGWIEEDASPLVDETTGCLLDFMNTPNDVRRRIWPRAVARLEARPYSAALVAHHAVHVHATLEHHDDPAWQDFLDSLERVKLQHLRAAAAQGYAEGNLPADYFFVRMGDLASLTFCSGWTQPQRYAGYELRLRYGRLTVDPDPFAGREVPFSVTARRLPNRPFPTRQEAAASFAAAPAIALGGIASGAGASGER